MLELALNNYAIYHNVPCPEDEPMFFFQPSYFHFRSRKPEKLAREFLKDNKCSLTIAEDGTGDIGSVWLDLISAPGSSYKSTFTVSPRRKVDGGYFNFFCDLDRWICGAWVSLSFAAARVSHTMCPREEQLDGPGTLSENGLVISNAIIALNNPEWVAGRFSPRTLSRTKVDDIQFKVGYNYYFCTTDHIGAYFVATAPTSKRLSSPFIFAPSIGSRHPHVGFGINTDFMVWDCCNYVFNWMNDFKFLYALPKNHCRLFDLCANGDWSRYLQVVTPSEPSNSMPGVNFFNTPVRVKPRSLIEYWTALHYNCCNWNLEVGYNLWWRQQERVCPCKARSLCVGIYDMAGDCQGTPVSASTANITQSVTGSNVAPSDPTFVTLTTNDFDFRSGAAPKGLSNTIYGAASYNPILCGMPCMIGFGGSYEFAHRLGSIEQWGVFVKLSAGY